MAYYNLDYIYLILGISFIDYDNVVLNKIEEILESVAITKHRSNRATNTSFQTFLQIVKKPTD